MTEPQDSGDLALYYCPRCVEAPDHLLATIRWCDPHAPSRDGAEDAKVETGLFLTGTAEADGQTCRAWSNLLHRQRSSD